MCHRATLITPLRERRPSAVTTASARTESLGLVPSTSEGSLGPAVAPWVKVPCDGPPSEGGGAAREVSGTKKNAIAARVAAGMAAKQISNGRRMGPLQGRRSCLSALQGVYHGGCFSFLAAPSYA